MPSMPPAALRAAFAERRRERQRHRDIAEQLGVSEGGLIAAHVGAHDAASPLRARRLRPEWPQTIAGLEAAGDVMALTRNASCVHEKIGTYRDASHSGAMGLVLGTIDLRLFYGRWAHGFAVDEGLEDGALQQSLQFFDAQGTAIHKVFAKPQTRLEPWAALVAQQASPDQATGLVPVPPPAASPEAPDAQIDVAAFRDGWAALQDTHEFFGLLRQHGLSRTQALRLADPARVQRLDAAALRRTLEAAAAEALPIMVFVGNPGIIQIHTGPVQRVVPMGPWINVLDPGFNLHLREDRIAQVWRVEKPTADGAVTSIECFDAAGDTIAMLFGERKPGRAELPAWRVLVERVREAAPCLA